MARRAEAPRAKVGGSPRICTEFSPVKSRDFTIKVCNPEKSDTKAELNRRSQACDGPDRHRCSHRVKWSARRVTLPLALAPEASASLLGYALKNPKRTESGFQPLLRPCGVSAGRLDSLGKMDGHESNALSISVWKTDVFLSTPMPEEMESRAGIAPASAVLQTAA